MGENDALCMLLDGFCISCLLSSMKLWPPFGSLVSGSDEISKSWIMCGRG
jgi:hypothetical protein